MWKTLLRFEEQLKWVHVSSVGEFVSKSAQKSKQIKAKSKCTK